MFSVILPVVALLSSQVHAHGIVTKIAVGTKTYQGYSPDFQYKPTPPAVVGWTAPKTQDTGPIMGDKVNDPDIICHRGATPGKLSAEVAAGDKVTLMWTKWPDSHKGPMIDYLADCGGDCSTVDKTKLNFFKIDGVGMVSTKGNPARYADDDMIDNNNSWTVTIPANIKAGNYVLRHETIALHEAQKAGGAQLYPQCVNLKVTGSGTETPQGVPGTKLYTPTMPGIVFDIYKKYAATSDYPVPGPILYSGAAGNATQAAPAAGAPAPIPAAPAGAAGSAAPVPAAAGPSPSLPVKPKGKVATTPESGSASTPSTPDVPKKAGKKSKCKTQGKAARKFKA